MKIVILAAGKGTRLGNNLEPKAMTILCNGKSILQMQIDALLQITERKNIHVVVGYLKEKILEQFFDLNFIYNANYARENTSKSLLKALNTIENDDVLWINGDVVFHPSVLHIIEKPNSTMLVNTGRVAEEEVKYRADSEGKILEVSKKVLHADGEALGINFFKKIDLPSLKKNLALCKDQDYFEKAIELCIDKKMAVYAHKVNPNDCIEIDFIEDINRANFLIQSWDESK